MAAKSAQHHSEIDPSRVLIVIPSRFGSTRFPGKALADLAGEPLIVRVLENSRRIAHAKTIVVATDDQRICDAVADAGGQAEMTGAHETGTDRIGEVAARHDVDLVVNLQGDEPLLNHHDVDALIAAMVADPRRDVGTCAHAFSDPAQWRDPNAVKVICDREMKALYFSRAPIPGGFPGAEVVGHQVALRHVGIYAFRQTALQKFLAWPRTPLEISEGLEQLRALENGMNIYVQKIERAPVGVDTPEDLEQVRKLWQEDRSV
ncbi:MAG: 3-deoxy-D-manno-octulosonate cytidylyltransferase [Candidatus Krumholzibacteriia bacterium]|jgi:3-deoxy-D-manno-octulosonate cytidylyltransferase